MRVFLQQQLQQVRSLTSNFHSKSIDMRFNRAFTRLLKYAQYRHYSSSRQWAGTSPVLFHWIAEALYQLAPTSDGIALRPRWTVQFRKLVRFSFFQWSVFFACLQSSIDIFVTIIGGQYNNPGRFACAVFNRILPASGIPQINDVVGVPQITRSLVLPFSA